MRSVGIVSKPVLAVLSVVPGLCKQKAAIVSERLNADKAHQIATGAPRTASRSLSYAISSGSVEKTLLGKCDGCHTQSEASRFSDNRNATARSDCSISLQH